MPQPARQVIGAQKGQAGKGSVLENTSFYWVMARADGVIYEQTSVEFDGAIYHVISRESTNDARSFCNGLGFESHPLKRAQSAGNRFVLSRG